MHVLALGCRCATSVPQEWISPGINAFRGLCVPLTVHKAFLHFSKKNIYIHITHIINSHMVKSITVTFNIMQKLKLQKSSMKPSQFCILDAATHSCFSLEYNPNQGQVVAFKSAKPEKVSLNFTYDCTLSKSESVKFSLIHQ